MLGKLHSLYLEINTHFFKSRTCFMLVCAQCKLYHDLVIIISSPYNNISAILVLSTMNVLVLLQLMRQKFRSTLMK